MTSKKPNIAKPTLTPAQEAFIQTGRVPDSDESASSSRKTLSWEKDRKVRITLTVDESIVIALKVASVKESRPAAAIVSDLVRKAYGVEAPTPER